LSTLPSGEEIALLREEHRAIVRDLGSVQRLLHEKKQHPQRRRESIDVLGARLRVHFAHEEETVYKPLNSVLKGRTPTKELMQDHRSIRQAFERLSRLSASRGNGQASLSDLTDLFQFLQSALGKHLEKEEKVVFWLAEYHL